MATSATGSTSATPVPDATPKSSKTTKIATWLPGMVGFRRVITKANAKDSLLVEIDADLVWEQANNWRQDVSGAPDAVLAMLQDDKDFKVSDET